MEAFSRITSKGQVTVPKAVRRALGVDYGGRIAFCIEGDAVTVRGVDAAETDPVIDRFLAFLAHDLEQRPEAIAALAPDLATRIAAVTAGLDDDPDAPIDGEVEL